MRGTKGSYTGDIRESPCVAIPSDIVDPEQDRFAPAPPGAKCTSRAGRARLEHELDRDGRCVYCAPPVTPRGARGRRLARELGRTLLERGLDGARAARGLGAS